MANWYGSARSNYFRVKAEDHFRKWAESIGRLAVVRDDEGRVALLSEEEDGGWPSERYNEATEDFEAIDLFGQVADHLQEGSVAVFVEIGAEKLRLLTAHAVAVSASGQMVEMSLDEIYERAVLALGGEVTRAYW